METNKQLWWGYKHISGTLQTKPYFDKRDTDEAEESPFVDDIVYPFYAENREEALKIVQEEIVGKNLKNLMKSIPIKDRIFTLIQMGDNDNWKNGTYVGDMNALLYKVKCVLQTIYEWHEDGCPGLGDLDLEEFRDCTDSGICTLESDI